MNNDERSTRFLEYLSKLNRAEYKLKQRYTSSNAVLISCCLIVTEERPKPI